MSCCACGSDLGAHTYFRRPRDGREFFLCANCKATVTKEWAEANQSLAESESALRAAANWRAIVRHRLDVVWTTPAGGGEVLCEVARDHHWSEAPLIVSTNPDPAAALAAALEKLDGE